MGALCLHMFLARLCSFLCPEENYLALKDAAMDLPIPDDPPVTIAVRVLVLTVLAAAFIARTPKPPHNRLHIPTPTPTPFGGISVGQAHRITRLWIMGAL